MKSGLILLNVTVISGYEALTFGFTKEFETTNYGDIYNGYRVGFNGWYFASDRQRLIEQINGGQSNYISTTKYLLQNGKTYLVGFMWRNNKIYMIYNGDIVLSYDVNAFNELYYVQLYVWGDGTHMTEYDINWIAISFKEPIFTIL